MRRPIIHVFLAAFLMQCVPYAPAQSGEASNELPARAQSTNASNENASESGADASAEQMHNWDHRTSALRYRRPTLIHRRPHRALYDAEDSRATWWPNRRRRHALIGAIIGFGIGAAIGAKGNQDQHTRARVGAPLIGGTIGALIGAAVGGSHP